MRRKIIFSLLILFMLFATGATVATLYTKNTVTEVEHLLSLHQIKGFRQNLILYIQAAQSDLFATETASTPRHHSFMQNVSGLEKASKRCVTCHHPPEIAKKIDNLEALILNYITDLKSYMAVSGDEKTRDEIRHKATQTGSRLLIESEEMSFQASDRLDSITRKAREQINIVGFIVYITIFLTCIFGVIIAIRLTLTVTRPIKELVKATRKIASGKLGYTVSYQDKTEFGELASTFNTMSIALKDGYTKLQEEISERKAVDEKLMKQNEFVRNTLESLSHPFYVIDANDYTIKLANSAAFFGEIKDNLTCYQLTHKHDEPCSGIDHPCTIAEIKKNGKPVTLEHIHYDKDGIGRFFEVHGYPICDTDGNIIQIIEYNIDVTERKRLEDQLRQTQKMESIGQLAGGIAHDFNNLLSPIVGYSEMLMHDISLNDDSREKVSVILESGKKAASLTRQLLAFSRKQTLRMKVLSLPRIVEDMLKILQRFIGEDISLRLNIKDDVSNIKADPGQIEQVLMNLAVNARQAMPSGGQLLIKTKNATLTSDDVKIHPEITPGPYVMLEVSDTGKGMSQEVQKKMFEPFFTTKGMGTGLGLATVYGIVKQHNGYIYVESTLNRGTTFRIYFPVSKDVEEKQTEESKTIMLRGNETILVVDDEPTILKIVADTLQPLGYTVLEASSGQEALNISMETAGHIDLLLTDVIMPTMNGRELFESISSTRPVIKVIFMSGYTDDIISHHGIFESGEKFLPKPLTPGILSREVRNYLDESS